MKKIFFVLALLSNLINAQYVYDFLRFDLNPRAAAVAGSFVANNDDPNVIFYNPAGINFLEGQPISFSFTKHLLDVNYVGLSSFKEFESIGKFGAAIQYLNYGSFKKTDQYGKILGDFSAGDLALTVGYGNELDKNFYYGANVKFIYSKIDEVSSTAAAIDLGLQLFVPDSKWNFGFSVLNIGSQISSYYSLKEDLPLEIKLGFTKQLENLPLKIFWSFNKLNEKQNTFFKRFTQITFGGEFKLGQSLKLRFGYDTEKRKELRLNSSAGLAGFNLGVGFIVKSYNIDYSFSSFGFIGSVHRFGISTNL
ncbi:MAG: type IX secretion system protein PorQ [Melioribacteraceae bacterium]|nr:type IX secretion system protein PorQ [Melioribacteraceae bacterium]